MGRSCDYCDSARRCDNMDGCGVEWCRLAESHMRSAYLVLVLLECRLRGLLERGHKRQATREK